MAHLLSCALDTALLLQGDAVEDFTHIDRARLEKTFLVNIVGMISLAQKAVPHMQPGSAIINARAQPLSLLV
jgi:NAD(P)-dependent dehydrogenase (short-subunit alcohol dehydrogenase family)